MDRTSILRRGISKQMLGIEVGPWFAPLVPKREGYNSLVLDVYDQERLLEHARSDKSIPEASWDLIESVDLLGGATDLAELVRAKGLVGQIDYVISSHNFEHLPNPLLFLQGCQEVLKPGGVLSMAIPDRRGCFDYFRPVTTTGAFLDAARRKLDHPTAAAVFDERSLGAKRSIDGIDSGAWSYADDGNTISWNGDVTDAYRKYGYTLGRRKEDYFDTHCSVFTRASFELVARDLHFLGIIDLGVEEIAGPAGCEFYTRLAKGLPVPSKSDFDARRAALVHEIIDDAVSNSRLVAGLQRQLAEQKIINRSLLESRSWRMTAPFRRVTEVLPWMSARSKTRNKGISAV